VNANRAVRDVAADVRTAKPPALPLGRLVPWLINALVNAAKARALLQT
jgi:hypothetical protein